MKKTTCILIIFITALSIQAQTEKGKIIITSGSDISCIMGNNSFEYDGKVIKETKARQISFEPSIGFFLIDDLAIGLSIPLNYSENSDDEFNTNISSYGLAPFIRYYIGESKVKPYLSFDLGYLITKAKSNINGEIDDTYAGIIADGGIGISAFFSDRVAFDTQLMYGISQLTYYGDTDLKLNSKAFGLLIGITVTF